MDKELKNKWVEALTNNSYTQIKLALREGDGYCCLGVLCDISNIGEWWDDVYRIPLPEIDEFGNAYLICEGASVSALKAIEEEDADILAEMNDGGSTFVEIAAWIEENIDTV